MAKQTKTTDKVMYSIGILTFLILVVLGANQLSGGKLFSFGGDVEDSAAQNSSQNAADTKPRRLSSRQQSALRLSA